MIQHIKLLGLVVNFIIGTWIVIYIYQTYKTYTYSFLKWLAFYTILFNFLFVGLIFYVYSKLNLPENFLQTNIPAYQDIFNLVLSLLVIFWLYAMLQIILSFFDKIIRKKYDWLVFAVCSIILLGYTFKIIFPENSSLYGWLIFIRRYIIENILILELFFLLGLLIFSKKIQDFGRKRISKMFGYFYLSRYAIAVIMVVLNLKINIPEPFRFIIGMGCLLFFNLMPYIWTKKYFFEYAKSLSKIVAEKIDLKSIYEKYNISKREQEILTLILDGKNNREIEEILFISYHTVKNHVYNIFQKFNVKNRFELIHIITKYQS